MQEKGQEAGFEKGNLVFRFHEDIPGTAEAANELVPRLMEIVREMECAPGAADKVELALQEALNNAILHGSRNDPDKSISVTCLCDEGRGILLIVRDGGEGFDMNKIPDPTRATNIYSSHGRGIYLIRELMDEVRFEDGGRTVVMKKNGKTLSA